MFPGLLFTMGSSSSAVSLPGSAFLVIDSAASVEVGAWAAVIALGLAGSDPSSDAESSLLQEIYFMATVMKGLTWQMQMQELRGVLVAKNGS